MAADKLAIVNEAYASFGRGDINGFFKDFSPDAILREAESLPYAGEHRGQEAATKALISIGTAWKDINYDIKEILQGETYAIAYGIFEATSRSTGKSVSMPLAEVWEFDGDKVKSVTPLYFDTAAALAALS